MENLIVKTNRIVVDSNPVQLNQIGGTEYTHGTNNTVVMGGTVMKVTSNRSEDENSQYGRQVVKINMTGA